MIKKLIRTMMLALALTSTVALADSDHFGIEGKITLNGQPLSGVTVSISETHLNATTTTNSSGDYSFENLHSGKGHVYTITPSLSGYCFNPRNVVIDMLPKGETILNFRATQGECPTPTPNPTPTSTPSPTPGATPTPTPPSPNDGKTNILELSTRGFVGTGDKVIISGFIVVKTGNPTLPQDQSVNVVLRGLGQDLAAFGLTNLLGDPILSLYNQNGDLIGINDDWKSNPIQAAAISQLGLAPKFDTDAAFAMRLEPGNYTAILRGVDDTTGQALIEVYNVGAGK